VAAPALPEDGSLSAPKVDPLPALLASLTREGKIVAAFESAHESFHRYHEGCLRLAAAATSDVHAREQLRQNLNDYMNHFHDHHLAEEVHLFPALRRADPALNFAVDRLVEQHERLAEQLTVVSQHIRRLDSSTAGDDIPALVEALVTLHDIVAEHLPFEESITNPVISTWTHWPL
jgi:hemerythrin-like domain-containing protein